jgi:hypothetical protein
LIVLSSAETARSRYGFITPLHSTFLALWRGRLCHHQNNSLASLLPLSTPAQSTIAALHLTCSHIHCSPAFCPSLCQSTPTAIVIPKLFVPFAKPISQPSTSLPATRLSQHPTGHERHFWPHSDSIQHSTHAPRTGRGARCPAPSQPPPPSVTAHYRRTPRTLLSTLVHLRPPQLRPASTSCEHQCLRPASTTSCSRCLDCCFILFGFWFPIPSRIVQSSLAATYVTFDLRVETPLLPPQSRDQPTIASSARPPSDQRQDVIAPAQRLQ